jgi:urea transport system ATP-binding protein
MRAVIGPNGAGKTTFMDIVTGKTRPDEGTVRWGEMGHSLCPCPRRRSRARGSAASSSAHRVRGPERARQPARGAEETARALRAMFDRVGSADRAGSRRSPPRSASPTISTRKAGILSHGQKQWLEIGMLLAQDPRLLLVDEPAAGMTTEERNHTADLLKRLAPRPTRSWSWNMTWNSSAASIAG